jgi:hypothetical protein
LTVFVSADIMSDMKTFTARELDRETTRVLDACDAEGAVRIRRRNGRAYTLQPELPKRNGVAWTDWWEERQKWIKQICPEPLTRKQARAVDRMIRGE